MEQMKRRRIELSDFHSPVVYWAMCGLFTAFFVILQLVDVIPYPQEKRDAIIGSVTIGGTALVFLWLAVSFRR